MVRRISDETVKTFVTSDNFSEATMQLTDYLRTLGLSDDSIYRIQQRFNELLSSGNNINEAMEVLGRELNELGEQSNKVRNLNQEAETLSHILKVIGQRFKENFDLDTAIRNVNGMIAGLGQLASSLSMVKNLANIWNDENLSSWEKILQITINLSTILFMINNSFKSISKGWESLPTVINNLTVAIGGLTGKKAKATLATKGLGASLRGLWGVLKKALITAAPYIAIITAIGVAVWGVVKAYNAEADAAKAAAEAEEELKKQLEETKTAYNELISAI